MARGLPVPFESAAHAAAAALERMEADARRALGARGSFRLGLSGGRSPQVLYHLLAGGPRREWLDPERTRFFFADERAVPPDHPESNYRLVRESLLDPLRVPARCVHRMRGEAADLEAAAAEYDALLVTPLDVLILGVGEDGHIASLFPGSALLGERTRRVAVVTDSPKPPARRLSLTPPAIAAAGRVLVLAGGAEKADAVARALDPRTPPEECPAALVRGAEWLLDPAAATKLAPRGGDAGRRP